MWMFPKIGGTPKSSILLGFSIINHPLWGTTIFGNTHVLKHPKKNAEKPVLISRYVGLPGQSVDFFGPWTHGEDPRITRKRTMHCESTAPATKSPQGTRPAICEDQIMKKYMKNWSCKNLIDQSSSHFKISSKKRLIKSSIIGGFHRIHMSGKSTHSSHMALRNTPKIDHCSFTVPWRVFHSFLFGY